MIFNKNLNNFNKNLKYLLKNNNNKFLKENVLLDLKFVLWNIIQSVDIFQDVNLMISVIVEKPTVILALLVEMKELNILYKVLVNRILYDS